MATTGASSTISPTKSRGFTVALASAVFEWILIVLLFVEAIFSYLLTRFARYCKLQTPCFLCSRLDHVLGNEKHGFYWDLMCRNHKLEISSLVFCHGHNKLVCVHGLCESCLFSFATINKSNSETYKLLVGKLGEEPHFVSSSKRHCSCCNELLISTCYTQKLTQPESVGSDATEFDPPLSAAVIRSRSNFKRSKSSLVNGFDLRSHVGYTEIKITSDTESDVQLSDYDDRSPICETDGIKEDFQVQSLQVEPNVIAFAGDLISEIPINPPPFEPEPSKLVSEVPSVANEGSIDHGLQELTWQQAEAKIEPPSHAGLISSDPSSSNAKETTIEVFRKSCISGDVSGSKFGQTCASETEDISNTSQSMTAREMAMATGPRKSNSLDLGDAYKLATGNRGRQLSDLFSEQWSGKESAGVNEDMKLLRSQISANRGTELPVNDAMNTDELKSTDASGSIGLQMLQKRISLERNESGLESLDGGSIVSEIEGESLVDRLKRQVEHDRKSLSALYKELDEERNASAVAASQTMAMITRLQEEKAALHMEAQQYLRMMEEQAEYDMEALQKAEDLLAEKEKEMQDLEEEIEFYREKFPSVENLENPNFPSCVEDNTSFPSSSIIEKPILCREVEVSSTVKNPLSEFEDERFNILQCLKKLEKKLQLFSKNGECLDLPNGEYSGNTIESLNCKKKSDESSLVEENSDNFIPCRENDLVTFRKDVSNLNGRLEALEANQNFIENAVNLLKNGDEGLKFVQKIVRHLEDLRRSISVT